MTVKSIDLGCGKTPVSDEVLKVDIRARNNPDKVIDLDETSWDLPSNHFSEIHIRHVLEHLENWEQALKEIYRIAEPGATVHVRVPHRSRGGAPDHSVWFGVSDLEKHCNPESQEYIGDVDFDVLESSLHWRHYSHYESECGVFECKILDNVGRLIDAFVNKRVVLPFAERFDGWFSGFEEIYWKVEVKKND